MLQIASGMYFPDDDVWETTHRRAFYSNAVRVRGDDISLPIGTLHFTNGSGAVRPLLIEATDRLPKRDPDGSESIHIATGGDELVEDVADVTAFVFDAVVTADPELADHVVAGRRRGGQRPIKHLRRVTDDAHHITDEDIAKAADFCSALLALDRKCFEATMRAIRRVADAVALSATDVTLSYTLFVAALESLSGDTAVPQLEWDQYDKQKGQLVDAETAGLPEDRIERIRGAVLGIDSMRISRKFQAFVLEHVSPEFYRQDAVGADRAVRSVDLPKALDFAYSIRSRAMHELRDLAPELWRITGFEETIWHEGRTVLTLEGLHRLSQHVIREYVRRAPTGVDTQFQANWRDSIPGVVKVELAPQYWLPSEPRTDAAAGPRMFGGLVESVLAVTRGEAEGVVDLADALARIESRLRTESDAKTRLQLAATYALWHAFMREDFHRPSAAEVADSYMSLLSTPTIYSYVINLLGGAAREWSDDDVFSIADSRWEQLRRGGKTMLRLPRVVDGALAVDAALRSHKAASPNAAARVAAAAELLPGDWRILDLLARIEAGEQPAVDLNGFLTAKQSDA